MRLRLYGTLGALRKPYCTLITIGMFNQLSGINAILYYSNYIFAAAGFGESSATLQSVGVGAMNLLATLLGMALIDKVGCVPLLAVVLWIYPETKGMSLEQIQSKLHA